jgi:hypothetical protein
MIKRFEDEYPETRLASDSTSSTVPLEKQASLSENSIQSEELQGSTEMEASVVEAPGTDDEEDNMRPTLSRHNSDVSLASKAFTEEEGRMHRFGQQFRRDILKPETEDHEHGTTGHEISEPHLQMLRATIEELGGEEIKRKVEESGPDAVIHELNEEASVLRQQLMESDPDGWEKFRVSMEVAARNQSVAGLDPDVSVMD